MTSNFQQYGRALLGNGYLIIPIKPGHKRPALDNWQGCAYLPNINLTFTGPNL